MFNVVVRNERVSSELIQNRCLNYNVTFIPQNRVDSHCIPPHVVQKMKEFTNGKVWLAKELVDYDPEFEPAINFAFGNWFIAENPETAKKVIDNNWGRYDCVTLQGDKYSRVGTLEGGFKNQSGLLLRAQTYQEILRKGTALDDSLKRVNRELAEIDSLQRAYQDKQLALENQKNRLETLEAQSSSGHSLQKLADQKQNLQEEVLLLKKRQFELAEEFSKAQEEVKALEKDLADLGKGSSPGNKERLFSEKLQAIGK
jgi:structural maintenance of chromosome 2